MKTITIELTDEEFEVFDKDKLKKLIHSNTIDKEKFFQSANNMLKAMEDAKNEGVNWEKEFEKAREEAFKEYQASRKLRA